MKSIIRRALALVAVPALALIAAGTIGTEPASASPCNIASWAGPNGGTYPITMITYTVRSPLGYDQGLRKACAVVGLMPGSDPGGMWRIRVRIQDTDDYAYTGGGVWAWDDLGQSRIQFLPTSWASWGEGYQITGGQYAGDWNSADWAPNGANNGADYVTGWFSTPSNGNPYTWGIRAVEQWHTQPRQGSPWQWDEWPTTSWHIPAL